MTTNEFRERLLESNDRWMAAMLDAIHAHQAGVLVAAEAFGKLDDLVESIEELKDLIMAQGIELQVQGDELRALRKRLNGGTA